VTARARLILLLGILAAVVAVRAAQPGAMFALDGAPEPFPAGVVVAAPAAVNIYGDRPDLRVLQLMDGMNAMWTRAFAAAGDTYEPPLASASAGPPPAGCGSGEHGWAGIYCRDDARIVVDTGDQQVRRAVLGEEGADAMLGYVLAHEIGHHVQAQRGEVHAGSQDAVVRSELHAECLAGLWGRAAGHPPPPDWTYRADADHGSVAQQRHWLLVGHRSGRPADCDAVFD